MQQGKPGYLVSMGIIPFYNRKQFISQQKRKPYIMASIFLSRQEKERMYMVKTMKMAVKKVAGMKKAVAGMCSAAYMAVISSPAAALAAGGGGANAVTQPLNNLKTLVIAVIGAVGVIILAKNVMEFAQAYQQQDSSTMNSALKGIVAGVMMAGISSVLTFLGF